MLEGAHRLLNCKFVQNFVVYHRYQQLMFLAQLLVKWDEKWRQIAFVVILTQHGVVTLCKER